MLLVFLPWTGMGETMYTHFQSYGFDASGHNKSDLVFSCFQISFQAVRFSHYLIMVCTIIMLQTQP